MKVIYTALIFTILCILKVINTSSSSTSELNSILRHVHKIILDKETSMSAKSSYEQFERYDKNSLFVDNSFYRNASECELDTFPDFLAMCFDKLDIKGIHSQNNNSQLYWPGLSDKRPTCEWNVLFHQIIDIDSGVTVNTAPGPLLTLYHFQVNSTCQDITGKLRGGASLQALIQGAFLEPCWVFDNFDDTYDVFCSPHKSTLFGSSIALEKQLEIANTNLQCIQVSLVLNFEHFAAYYENGIYWGHYFFPSYIMLHHSLYNERICFADLKNKPRHRIPRSTIFSNSLEKVAAIGSTEIQMHSPKSMEVITGAWSYSSETAGRAQLGVSGELSNASSPLIYYFSTNPRIAAFNALPTYKFVWSDPLLNQIPYDTLHGRLMQRLKETKVYYVGESHMRYAFVEMYYEVGNITQTVFQWGSGDRGNMKFRWVLFMRNLAEYLTNMCTEVLASGEHVIVLIQTASWDIAKFPLHHLIKSPLSSPLLLQAIAQLKARGCAKFLQLIYIEPPPYPVCSSDLEATESSIENCINGRENRNNYNLQAFNYHIQKALRRIAYPGLQYIKSFDIIYPRTILGEAACTAHYLCEYGKATAPGLVLVDAMKHAIVRAGDRLHLQS